MLTIKSRLGFLSIVTLFLIGLSSCEETELAHANVTVLQEYTASQGQVNQTRPVEGAEVRFYVPGAPHLEALEFTNTDGKVSFSYEYQSLILIEILYQNEIYDSSVRMEVGETVNKEIVLPE